MIPLILKLRKQEYKDIAKAQDLIVETLNEVFSNYTLHGGTAIWRCYNGNRFSEDVDVYIGKNIKKIDEFFNALKKKGFVIEKRRIREASLYSRLRFNRTVVKFEALFKSTKGNLKEYETAEGNLINVYTLTPEEFIKEKADTYLSRFKIRDLYDIFFLIRYVKDISQVKENLKKLTGKFKAPIDEKDLKILIIEGLTPNTEKMLDYIKRSL